ncbi:MAG: ubiquinone/menaquinone biosynthesis methyltransferase, partial [Planctomycetia bacterium]
MSKPADAVDKRGDKIRAMFGSIAGRYDLLNSVLSMTIDRWWRRLVVRKVPPENGSPILDCCTGTGELAVLYARRAGGRAPVVAADFCHEMLQVAAVKRRRLPHPFAIVEADALQLPFPDGLFQLVTVAFGLRNVADSDRGIAEMIRVVEPGGRLAILEFSRPRVPGLRWLYLAYFRYILPKVGQKVSANNHDAYNY